MSREFTPKKLYEIHKNVFPTHANLRLFGPSSKNVDEALQEYGLDWIFIAALPKSGSTVCKHMLHIRNVKSESKTDESKPFPLVKGIPGPKELQMMFLQQWGKAKIVGYTYRFEILEINDYPVSKVIVEIEYNKQFTACFWTPEQVKGAVRNAEKAINDYEKSLFAMLQD